jgi:hypothetical protein
MPAVAADVRDAGPESEDGPRPRVERARNTPALLRLCAVAILVAIAVVWAVGWTSATHRHATVHAIGTRTEPLIVEAQQIHAALSAADASAAHAFLAGGAGSPAQEARYDRSISAAANTILVAEQGQTSAADRAALTTISQELPVYTGLVAQAGALNRQNLPLGAAYLRHASSLMQSTILTATDAVTTANAARLDRAYRSATGTRDVVVLAAAVAAAALILIGIQVLVLSRTNRILNLPLLIATVVLLGAVVWVMAAFSTQRSDMVRARDQGYVPSSLLSEARVLAFRADGDQSLSVIARGDGAAFDSDFKTAMTWMGFPPGSQPAPGALTDALHAPGASAVAPQISAAVSAIESYAATNADIRRAVASGRFTDAVALVEGGSATSFGRFDAAASSALSVGQQRFVAGVTAADHRLRDLGVVVTVAALIAAALAVVGLQLRAREYR